MKYLLQQGNFLAKEKMAVQKQPVEISHCAYENLNEWIKQRAACEYVPVGTVEFVQRFCTLAWITLPANMSYPPMLSWYLQRDTWTGTFESADPNCFVKPRDTKVFTGGIKSQLTETVAARTPVWIAEPVTFAAEFRYYVLNGQIVGFSRYDDGDDPVSADESVVTAMIAQWESQPVGYSIDVGIVDGATVLIEVNDGWSLGLYPWGTMTDAAYVDLITQRWVQIFEDQL